MRARSRLGRLARRGALAVQRALVARAIGKRRARAGLRERVVRVDGRPVAYLERPGAEPALVLIHGFGGDKDAWLRLVPALDDGRRVLAVDLAGHGDSPAEPGAAYALPRYVADVTAWLEAVAPGRVDLAGNSMGGSIATVVALERPDRVRALVLLDPAGGPTPTMSWLDSVPAGGANPLVPTTPAEFDRLLAFVYHRPPTLPGIARTVLADRAAGRAPFLRDLLSNLEATQGPLLDRLPEVRTPTLLIWGAADRVLDVSAAPFWAEALPDARLAVLDGVGHVPMMEAPGETARLIRDFLGAQ